MLSALRRLIALVLRYWRYLYPAPPPKQIDFTYYDSKGQGYTRDPDWMKATAVDEGQWDDIKRQMRIALWRARHGLPETVDALDMRPIGVAFRPLALPNHVKLASLRPSPETVPALYPFDTGLTLGCKELGFVRLALAAMPDASDAFLRQVYDANAAGILANAEAMQARNLATKANPPPGFDVDTFRYETVEELTALWSIGDYERPDLDACPPLSILRIGVDNEAMPPSNELGMNPPPRA